MGVSETNYEFVNRKLVKTNLKCVVMINICNANNPSKKLKGDMVINCNYAAVDVDFSYINARCSSGDRTIKGF